MERSKKPKIAKKLRRHARLSRSSSAAPPALTENDIAEDPEVPAALTEDDHQLDSPDAPLSGNAHLEVDGAAPAAAAAEAVAEVPAHLAAADEVEVEFEVEVDGPPAETDKLDDDALKRKMHSAFWLHFFSRVDTLVPFFIPLAHSILTEILAYLSTSLLLHGPILFKPIWYANEVYSTAWKKAKTDGHIGPLLREKAIAARSEQLGSKCIRWLSFDRCNLPWTSVLL